MVHSKNPHITISPLGEERKFVSGNKYWLLDWAELSGNRFEIGDTVSWRDLDEGKAFKGKIEWICIIDDGYVQISIDNPNIGRIDLDEVVMIKKGKK